MYAALMGLLRLRVDCCQATMKKKYLRVFENEEQSHGCRNTPQSNPEVGDDDEEEVDAVVELTSKEQSARSLEIRRAIERRMEERQLHEDVDYLDLDPDE